MTLEREIKKRVEQIGTDGKFIANQNGKIIHVNLTEKNTRFNPREAFQLYSWSRYLDEHATSGLERCEQRLSGSGVSMVTLYYLRRYLTLFRELFQSSKITEVQVSKRLQSCLARLFEIFNSHLTLLNGSISDKDRNGILDKTRSSRNKYRNKIYSKGFSERRKNVTIAELREFIELSLSISIILSKQTNEKITSIMHTTWWRLKMEWDFYTSLVWNARRAGSSSQFRLSFLRENQWKCLDALRASALYRKDQSSYLLYPDRQLPRFVEKNTIPKKEFEKSALLKKLVENEIKQIVLTDLKREDTLPQWFPECWHFWKTALDELRDNEYQALVQKEREFILDTMNVCLIISHLPDVQEHSIKYEGLGCITGIWFLNCCLLLRMW